jgi:hypothetical protein
MAIKKSLAAVQAAVANTLSANIAAEVAAVNAVWNDALTLVTPQVINGYRDPIPEYPSIVVSWVESSIALDAATQWQEVNHDVEATVLCQALNAGDLDAMTLRYLTAMWEVFLKNPGLDGSLSGNIGFAVSKMARSQVYRIKDNQFLMRSAGLLGTVCLDESA